MEGSEVAADGADGRIAAFRAFGVRFITVQIMRRWIGSIGAFLLCAICASTDAWAQNLLKNSRFDTDLASWQSLEDKWSAPGKTAWSPLDANGSSSSGSLELRASALSSRETYSVGQCVAIPTPSEYVVFGGKIRVPSRQRVAGSAYLSLRHFSSANCSGPEGAQSGLGGLANADFWSRRTDSASIRGASSVRLIASSQKKYEWKEGDQTGEINDGVMFHAFFDDLFVYVTSEANLRNLIQSLPTGVPEFRTSKQTTASWGKNTVERPTLSVKVLRDGGTERDERVVELKSVDQIRLSIDLSTPYSYDDPRAYPLQRLSLAARNNEHNFGQRPTLELLVYRTGDPAKTPLKTAIDSDGGGGGEGASSISASINLTGKSDYRVSTLRALYRCLRTAYPNATRQAEDPTDDQLLAMPLAQDYVANPPGDYELVAKYFALEAGFWHEPVYSAPRRIRIFKRDFQCGKAPAAGGEDQQSAYQRLKDAFLNHGQPGVARARLLHDMVMANADQAFAIMPNALFDEDPPVREEAAEWLAIRGDTRGLDVKLKCVLDSKCSGRFRDLGRIGNSHRSEYAPHLVKLVEEAINRSRKDGRWSDRNDEIFVQEAVVALAKLGRRQDHALILRVVSTEPASCCFKALGYVDDPQSRSLLHKALEEMSAQERNGAGHVEALLALSRLGDPKATALFQEILLGKNSQRDRWLPNQSPQLSAERGKAFESLRARDASTFAETVLSVAAQEPEGPGTREAWTALGVMHPNGYGKRLLALALSRKLHWLTLAREVQFLVILSTEPDPALVTQFFSSFVDVQRIPDESGQISLIRAGLGNLLFGGWHWFGE